MIQECENPLETKNNDYINFAINHIWIGDNKNKGLGIFAKPSIKINKLNWTNNYKGHPVKYFLPIIINNSQILIGIWAHKNNSPTFGYIGQLWKYLDINQDKIKNSILIGDLNSNKIWDCWDRWWNHSDVVELLKQNDNYSLYHKLTNEKQGEELTNTFYLQKNIQKGYHIDYCFVPEKLLSHTTNLEIPLFIEYKEYSDHLPLIITLS